MEVEKDSARSDFKTNNHKNNRKRLIIKKIKLFNFKSYYGTHEIGPFHKNFSSIIGPNGSGKSNLIDSLVFIFGKRASWMRLKNLKELIHNSAKFGNCDKAEVTVSFVEIIEEFEKNSNNWENNEKYVEINDSCFSISRSISKNDESLYKINNVKSSHGDVVNLLKSKGIDLDNNRFMILQGEVEQISLMKAKSGNPENPGFLEYLEDIIGTTNYIEPIIQLEEQSDKYKTVVIEKNEDFRVLEEEIKILYASKTEAIDFLKQEKKIFQLNNFKFQLEINKIKEKINNLNIDLLEIEKIEMEEKKMLTNKVDENKHFFDKMGIIKKNRDELFEKINKLNNEYKLIEEKYDNTNKNLKELLEEENNIKKRREQTQNKITKLIEEKTALIQDFPKYSEELDKLKKQKSTLDLQIKEINKKLQGKLSNLQLELNEMNFKFIQLEKDKNQFLKLNEKFILDLKQNEDKQLQIKNKITSNKNEISNIDSKISVQKECIERLSSTKQSIFEDVRKKDIEISLIQQNLNSKLEEQKILKFKINEIQINQRNNDNKNRILKELIHAQSMNKLSGIRGRLGDLIICPKELDVAVSTAGHSSWDKIIVNSYDEAQRAIEYLRKEKIGKAGFLALDKITYLNNKINERNYNGSEAVRLYDLIKPSKEDLKCALFFAVSQTLLCDNIDIAKRVAFGKTRFRVVTKCGSLIEMTGLMSGGGEPKRGMVNINETNVDLSMISNSEYEFQTKIQLISGQITELQNNFESNNQSNEIMKKDMKRLEVDIDKKNNEIKEAISELELIKGQLNDANRALILLQKENELLKKSNPDHNMYDIKVSEINDLIIPLSENIYKIQKNIDELGGQELKSLKNKITEIENTISEKEDQLINKDVREKGFDKQIDKLKNDLDSFSKSIDQLEKNKKDIKKIQDDLTDDGVKNTNSQVNVKEELEKNNVLFEKARDEMKNFDKILQDLKEKIKELNCQKEEIRNKKSELNENNKNFENNLRNIRNEYKVISENYNFLNNIEMIEVMGSELGPNKIINQIDISQTEEVFNQINKNKRGNKEKRKSITEELTEIYKVDILDTYAEKLLNQFKDSSDSIKDQMEFENSIKASLKPNLDSILVFQTKYNNFYNMKNVLLDIKQKLENNKNQLDELKNNRRKQFLDGFNIISSKLKETYQMLTNGGDAELEIIDCIDPFSEGILFSVRPPRKSWKNISKLSGGEKTLSSLAFIYALHFYKPNPVYFMDEIDAALDYKNVSIVAKFIKEKTKDAQFIVISLRNNMYESAHKLFGIYKTFDVTKSISIEPDLIIKKIPIIEITQKDFGQEALKI